MEQPLQPRHKPLLIFLLFISISIYPKNFFAQGTVLVDFGTNAAGNTFGLAGWNQLLLSNDMNYSNAGPGGVTLQANIDEFTDFMGVIGTARQFSLGERIVVTWYNDSDDIIYLTSRISFIDQDNPSEGSPDGSWYTMRSFSDYRYTYEAVQPHSTGKTAFNITDHGVHKTDETYSLVNINLSIEWFDSSLKPFIICDKIELWNDADIILPGQPTELQATPLSSSKIQLVWNYPTDDIEVVEYLIYNDGIVEGYSRTNSYTAVFLNHNTEYTFTVSALDAAGNEGIQSTPATASTMNFQGTNNLINPDGFEYLGAIGVPEDFAYGGDGIAYNPNGDGGQSGIGSSDGFPGSFFISDINTPDRSFIAEVTIPAPVISPSKNLEELNQVAILQPLTNIRPANINSWDYVDVWLNGLEYVESENRLYNSWAIYFDVQLDKTASISCVDASNLAGGTKYGAWYLGNSSSQVIPIDPYLNDYLFQVPQAWADANIFGRALINGRYREGGLSGLGPTFYGINLIGSGTPPAANTEFQFSTLLQYGSVEGTDNYNYPNSIDGYNHADWWKDADWIEVDGQSAVAIIGNKALGQNYYGYNGEMMRHDWVIADQPYPEFWDTDPNGKGWKAHTLWPTIIFYKPSDFAAVANGTMQSYQPQAYAALRLDKNIFLGDAAEIYSAAYNQYNHLLFITEFIPEMSGNLAIHVWRISHITGVENKEAAIPTEIRLEQNYPNPFNPNTVISYQLSAGSFVQLKVYDLLGNEISTLVNEEKAPGRYEVIFDGSNLVSGVYIYQLTAGDYISAKQMLLLK